MEKNHIKLYQERDLGDVFNVSFAFIKQEFKTLGKAVLYYVIPFLLVFSILSIVIQKEMFSSMSGLYEENIPGSFPTGLFKYYLLFFLIIICMNVFMIGTIFGYFKVYNEKGSGNFEVNEIFEQIKENFFNIILASIVTGFLIGVGFVCCIIPGIYLGVSLSIIFAVLIIERQGFGSAFSRSFQLTKQQWWWTFLMLLVIVVVTTLLSYLIALPSVVVNFSKMLNDIKQGNNPYESLTTVDIVISSIISIVSYILYLVAYIIIGFQYFNLAEISDKTSLKDKIGEIGKDE